MKAAPLFALTAVLAYCSIVYEFVLAQSLAATLGGTFLRYNVTIALYLASLGFGALLCPKASRDRSVALLTDVELLLSCVGAVAPLAVLAWDAAVFRASAWAGFEFRGGLYQTLVYSFDHGLIALVGLSSGFELPLLMRLGRDPESGADRSGEVLAVDYAGTLAGAVLFPCALLPGLGTLTAAPLTALLNALCGLYLLFFVRRGGALRAAGFWAVILLCLGLILGRGAVQEAAERIYFLHP